MADRIVSFLPSATELIYELGAGDKIFGVTHECLYPDDAKSKPRVINSVFNPDIMTSKQIDDKIVELIKNGNDIYTLDKKNLIAANPDLIISQEICEVCSAYTNQVNSALSILDNKPDVQILNPQNLQQIIDSVSDIAKKIGKEEKGKELASSLKKRIEYVKNQQFRHHPRVLCIEWIEPFFTSGHWIPEMVEIAGAKNEISKTGEQSRRLSFDEIKKSNPEIIIVMPCGFNVNRTISEYNANLQNNSEWNNLNAVKENKVYVVDANSYFSKSSIRTISGLEILAKIFHPEIFADLIIPENSFRLVKKV